MVVVSIIHWKKQATKQHKHTYICMYGDNSRTVDSGTSITSIKLIELDEVVDSLFVSRSHRSSDKLGKTSVERVLSSLESSTGRASGTRLLSTHTETAGGSLSGSDTTSLALSALDGTGSRPEVGDGQKYVVHVVNVTLVGLAALPIIDLHGQVGSG